jgi:GNAT superfamily N-acetyltransferase
MLKDSNYRISFINSKDVCIVRQPVLREGKPIESCVFDGDDLEDTYHLGLFIDDKLIAVASFMNNSHVLFLEENQYQLRGMAVLKAYQGKSYGHIILKYGEDFLSAKGITSIWCNAREIAVNFYKKNNYAIKGDPFIIPEIGIHYVMQKHLK